MSDPIPLPLPSAGGTYVRLPDGSLVTLAAYEQSIAAPAEPEAKAGKTGKKE